MTRAVFGALAAACVGLIGAPTASAALGSIVVDGSVHRDPGGCLESTRDPAQLAVENHTDVTIHVYAWHGCRGEITAILTPGQIATVPGASISIP